MPRNIGPAQPRQICPDCEGEGYHKAGEYQEWIPGPSYAPSAGHHETRSTFSICETCAGEGRITKKHLKQLQAETIN